MLSGAFFYVKSTQNNTLEHTEYLTENYYQKIGQNAELNTSWWRRSRSDGRPLSECEAFCGGGADWT